MLQVVRVFSTSSNPPPRFIIDNDNDSIRMESAENRGWYLHGNDDGSVSGSTNGGTYRVEWTIESTVFASHQDFSPNTVNSFKTHKGKYLRVNGNSVLADMGAVGNHEKLYLAPVGDTGYHWLVSLAFQSMVGVDGTSLKTFHKTNHGQTGDHVYWEVINHSDGSIGLKSVKNGLYITGGDGGNAYLQSDGWTYRAKWTVREEPYDGILPQLAESFSTYHTKYLRIDSTNTVGANTGAVSTHEKLALIPYGESGQYWLVSYHNKRLIGISGNNLASYNIDDFGYNSGNTRWTLNHWSATQVGFRNVATGQVIAGEPDGKASLHTGFGSYKAKWNRHYQLAFSTWKPKPAQSFRTHKGKYLRYNGSNVVANTGGVGQHEKLYLEQVANSNYYWLKSLYFNKYIVLTSSGGLTVSSSPTGDNALWTKLVHSSGQVGLQNVQFGTYITGGDDGNAYMQSNGWTYRAKWWMVDELHTEE